MDSLIKRQVAEVCRRSPGDGSYCTCCGCDNFSNSKVSIIHRSESVHSVAVMMCPECLKVLYNEIGYRLTDLKRGR